jgi:two-component system, LytTR family, response regulator
MMINCLVVDDKPLAIDILVEYIHKISFLNLVQIAQNPLDALEFVNNNNVDLVFLDIQMPELNGMQFMRLLNGKADVILIIAYSEFALEGYEHDVIDYLLKPVSFERFYQAAEKARKAIEIKPAQTSLTNNNNAGTSSLFVKTEYKIQSIPIESILYIEARQNYVSIVTTSGQVMSLQNIKSMEEKLLGYNFLRVHKSFIVSINKINTVEKSRIQIGNAIIPVGDSYREAFYKRLSV